MLPGRRSHERSIPEVVERVAGFALDRIEKLIRLVVPSRKGEVEEASRDRLWGMRGSLETEPGDGRKKDGQQDPASGEAALRHSFGGSFAFGDFTRLRTALSTLGSAVPAALFLIHVGNEPPGSVNTV